MSRKKIVAGNWKMNKTLEEANALVDTLLPLLKGNEEIVKIIIPPFPFLSALSFKLINSSLQLGAQDCSAFMQGAYTGEVSAAALQSVGCKYVLVGHSERRTYHNETNELLIEKTKQALNVGLTAIFCFGESLHQRKANEQETVVATQITSVLNALTSEQLHHVILAYEPVWAIGTGETATPQQAQTMHQFIRALIEKNYGSALANSISILYGGSCNAQNAQELFACPDIDGGLIGGASLKADDFSKISYSF
jgi:triosephosphate isomerase (TIM)